MKAVEKQFRELFATPMFVAKVDDHTILDQAILDLQKLEVQNTGHRNDFCWTSDDNLNTLPQFKELTDFIHAEAGAVLDAMGIKRDSHDVTCMWSNVARVGHQHIMHVHSNSFLSGVIYLQTPTGAGATVFMDPRPAAMMWDPDYVSPEFFRTGYISNKPEKGVITFFPSWLAHGVDVGKDFPDQTRIIISFNIMIRGKMTQHSKSLVL